MEGTPTGTPEESERRSPGEVLLDMVLYAPLGVVDVVRREWPTLARRRRSQFDQQVRTARWVGEMAVRMGRTKLAEVRATRRQGAPAGSAESGGPVPHAPTRGADSLHVVSPSVPEPFPGYDALAAVDLVPILGRLSRPELEAVLGYESAMRNRSTVLARVEQLLAA